MTILDSDAHACLMCLQMATPAAILVPTLVVNVYKLNCIVRVQKIVAGSLPFLRSGHEATAFI